MCFHDAWSDGESPEQFMAENIPDMETLRHIIR